MSDGTSGRKRTGTLLPETDFESVASTNSATEAYQSPLLMQLDASVNGKSREICTRVKKAGRSLPIIRPFCRFAARSGTQ